MQKPAWIITLQATSWVLWAVSIVAMAYGTATVFLYAILGTPFVAERLGAAVGLALIPLLIGGVIYTYTWLLMVEQGFIKEDS